MIKRKPKSIVGRNFRFIEKNREKKFPLCEGIILKELTNGEIEGKYINATTKEEFVKILQVKNIKIC